MLVSYQSSVFFELIDFNSSLCKRTVWKRDYWILNIQSTKKKSYFESEYTQLHWINFVSCSLEMVIFLILHCMWCECLWATTEWKRKVNVYSSRSSNRTGPSIYILFVWSKWILLFMLSFKPLLLWLLLFYNHIVYTNFNHIK